MGATEASDFRLQASGYRQQKKGSSGSCVGRQVARQPFRRALGGAAPKNPEFIAFGGCPMDLTDSLSWSPTGSNSPAQGRAQRRPGYPEPVESQPERLQQCFQKTPVSPCYVAGCQVFQSRTR